MKEVKKQEVTINEIAMKEMHKQKEVHSLNLKELSDRILKSIRDHQGSTLSMIVDEIRLHPSYTIHSSTNTFLEFIETYQSRGQISAEEMHKKIDRLCKVFAKHRLYEMMARAKLLLAIRYLQTYLKYTEALNCIYEIEHIVQKYLDNDNMVLCEALFTKATVYQNQEQYEESTQCILQAQSLKVYEQATPELRFKSNINLARDFIFLGEYAKAEKHILLAEQSWELFQNDFDKAALYMRKADLLRLSGDWEDSLDIILECIDFYTNNGIKLRLAECYKELGEFYGRQENPIRNFELSLQAFESARTIAKELKILRLEGAIVHSIRVICLRFEEWKLCVEYMIVYEEFEQIIRREELNVYIKKIEYLAQQEKQKLLNEGKPTYSTSILEEVVLLREEVEDLKSKNRALESIMHDIESLINHGVHGKNNVGLFLDQLHRLVTRRSADTQTLESLLIQCDAQHPRFSAELLKSIPSITGMEMKVAKLIRLGMSSQSLAMICGVTIKSIENHRMKLRKKANLKQDQSLSAYIQAL
jgi:DNA-binding CsgD family transcriptional regulator